MKRSEYFNSEEEIIIDKKLAYYIWYNENQEILNKKSRDRWSLNIERNKQRKKEYYKENREIILQKEKLNPNTKIRKKAWQEANKETSKIKRKIYLKNNKEKVKAYKKEYNQRNKEKNKITSRNYRIKNKDTIRKKENEKRKNDPLFKLIKNSRDIILKYFKYNGFKKKSKTTEILGCSFEELKSYIESKFEPWMNWENRGLYNGQLNYGWDVDHIIPLSSAKSEEELIKLCHYINLQPLCSYTNRYIKRNKI